MNLCNRKYNINISTLFFVVSFYIYIFASVWAQTEFKIIYDEYVVNFFQWIAIFLIIAKIFYDKKINNINFLVWIVLSFVAVLISYKSGNFKKILPIFLYALAGSNVNCKTIVKTSFFSIITVMIITVLGSLIGIIPFEFYEVNGRIRYNLGFFYTSYISNYFFHVILMYIYVKKQRLIGIETFIILFLNYVIYRFTDTRAVYYEILVLIIMCWVLSSKTVKFEKLKLTKVCFIISFISCAFIALYLQIYYNQNIGWMNRLNYLLSYRLSLGHAAFFKYGLSFFGQVVEWTTYNTNVFNKYFFVDSSYLNVLLNYGVILFVLLIIGFTLLMKQNIEKKQLYCCIALLMLSVHSITDPQLFDIVCNPFLLLLGHFFSFAKKNNVVNKKSNNIQRRDI